METIYVVGIVVILILAVYFGVKHFKSSDTLNGEIIEQSTDRVITVIEAVLNAFDFNYKTKKSIQETLKIADEVAHYISKNLLNDNEDKVAISLAAIERILIILNAKPKEKEQELIDITVKESIKFIEHGRK